MRFVLLAVSGLAGFGLLLSLVVHVASIAGISLLGGAEMALHGGIFVVWIPAVLSAQKYTRNVRRKDVWKSVLRGCPTWMKWLTFGFFAYALANFAHFFLTLGAAASKHPGPPSAAVLRGFSGHWMAFYATAMSILYSSSRIPSLETASAKANDR